MKINKESQTKLVYYSWMFYAICMWFSYLVFNARVVQINEVEDALKIFMEEPLFVLKVVSLYLDYKFQPFQLVIKIIQLVPLPLYILFFLWVTSFWKSRILLNIIGNIIAFISLNILFLGSVILATNSLSIPAATKIIHTASWISIVISFAMLIWMLVRMTLNLCEFIEVKK
ncbi:MAG: hypothetical protein RR565_03475 [Erysipelothrix sp.]